MRNIVVWLAAVAGTCAVAGAVVNTRFDWQVSLDNTTWATSVGANPGQQVFVRGLLTYIGGEAPVGLANWAFQPTVSNWRDQGAGADQLLPFVNGGMGGNTSDPPGVVTDPSDPTQFGRLSPFGRTSLTSATYLRGFVHFSPNGEGVTFLRIAQANLTSWWGGQGNTAGGVGIAQLSNVGRLPTDPPFNASTQNVVIFRFGVVLGPDAATRDMTVSRAINVFTDPPPPFPEARWYASLDDGSGGIVGDVQFNNATIHVPSPAAGVLLVIGLGAGGGRRRSRSWRAR
jgi:hypothetical protein